MYVPNNATYKPKLTLELFNQSLREFDDSEFINYGAFVIKYYDVNHLSIGLNDSISDVFGKLTDSKESEVYENVDEDEPVVTTSFEYKLDNALLKIKDMLLNKNRKYGNAALEPLGIFAKGNASSLINVRIDDKLNRIKNQQEDEDEDAELDLIGYLILKQIAKASK